MHNCNVGTDSLPDMHTQRTRAADLRTKGVHIYQANHECPCYIKLVDSKSIDGYRFVKNSPEINRNK